MFERRFVPVYLAICALALALWTAFAPGSAPASTLSWALTGMVAVYALAILIDRATRSPRVVVLEEASRINAARVAAPGATASGEIADPRR
jgi:hypothetical protein